MSSLSYFCQKCGRGNAIGLELCESCGTRLLLIVEPPSARYEINYATPYEEHLLERISLLETYLNRMTERFEKILDLMMRQAQTAYLDHTLLESLIALLDGSGVIESGEVGALWQMRRTLDSSRHARSERQSRLKKHLLAQHKDGEITQFTAHIDEGLELLEARQNKRGMEKLESALLLSPSNGALLFLLGQHFYFAGKPTLASDYLAQSLLHDPQNGLACLLLGLLCGDKGDAGHAKTLLQIGTQLLGVNFPAHYALGRLQAAEGNWAEALSSFKKALAAKNQSEEAQFAVGCAYYALNRFKLALRFMHKVVEEDENYAEAWYRLGFTAWRLGDQREAQECFLAAHEAETDNVAYKKATRLNIAEGEAPPDSPLFGVTRRTKKLISGGDKRLAAYLRKEVEKLCLLFPIPMDDLLAELPKTTV